MLKGREDAEEDTKENRDGHPREGEGDGARQRVPDDVDHGTPLLERGTEVPRERLSDIAGVLDRQRPVQPQLMPEVVIGRLRLIAGRRAADAIAEHHPHRIAGDEMQDRKGQERHAEQHGDQPDQALHQK